MTPPRGRAGLHTRVHAHAHTDPTHPTPLTHRLASLQEFYDAPTFLPDLPFPPFFPTFQQEFYDAHTVFDSSMMSSMMMMGASSMGGAGQALPGSCLGRSSSLMSSMLMRGRSPVASSSGASGEQEEGWGGGGGAADAPRVPGEEGEMLVSLGYVSWATGSSR